MISPNNLFTQNVPDKNSEIFTTLFQNNSIKIEAIRSWLKVRGEVYNQDRDEWVILLKGKASLEIGGQTLALCSGDYLFIPKHTPHRVLSTSKNALWIGVFSS